VRATQIPRRAQESSPFFRRGAEGLSFAAQKETALKTGKTPRFRRARRLKKASRGRLARAKAVDLSG